MRILIVEDEYSIARDIKWNCQRAVGEKIESLEIIQTLDNAADYLQKNQIDLLLLDLNLSGKSGFELLKTSVSGSFHTIIISAHTDHHEACWQWVIYISKQPYYRLAPARKSLLYSEEYEEEVGSRVATAARASIENAVLVTPRLITFSQVIEEAFLPAIESVVEGATPEEAMIAAQGQAEIILGQ